MGVFVKSFFARALAVSKIYQIWKILENRIYLKGLPQKQAILYSQDQKGWAIKLFLNRQLPALNSRNHSRITLTPLKIPISRKAQMHPRPKVHDFVLHHQRGYPRKVRVWEFHKPQS